MPSIIICQGTSQTRAQEAENLLGGFQIQHLSGQNGKIKIAQIKELLPHLYVKPVGAKKMGVIIAEAQQMGVEPQNALLKSLEEPPEYLTFVLTTPSPKLLLPTVVSRCMILKVEDRGGKTKSKLAAQILEASPGHRLEIFAEEVGYKLEDALNFLDEMETTLGEQIKSQNKLPTSRLIKLWQTKKLLRNPHANLKLTVDEYLLSW